MIWLIRYIKASPRQSESVILLLLVPFYGDDKFSRTPARDLFPLFYPCEIILFHIPLPVLGKDKTNSRTSIRDVIDTLKCQHHVASQRIQDFLEAFCDVLSI